MAGSMMDMAKTAASNRMQQGQDTGNFGNKEGFQKFVNMPGSQAPQQPQGMAQQGQGMDQQFGSLIQMLMGGQQPRGRG